MNSNCWKNKGSVNTVLTFNKSPLLLHGIIQARILEWVNIPFSR